MGTLNVFGLVKVDESVGSAAKTINQQEYRWRRVLLNKVKYFWIDGVLAKSLHKQVMIDLGLEERKEFVQNQLSEVEEFPSYSVQVFPPGTTAAEIFEGIGAGRTLLILGEPGCGKTVTLLKLAQSLIARSENDLSQPLPIVVNLSSWAKQRQSIVDWLVQEIHDIYGVSKSLGKIWVEQEQLILLLDGLDEVDGKYRNDCVKALNQFIQTHGLTEIVVCSRIRNYENLSERLKLRSAIYVQSLTSQQIDQFLQQAGESLFSLKTFLQNNPEIRTFASSPLILSIMSLAYQGCSEDTIQTISTADTFHQHLFDTYIERMFTRRGTTCQFSQQQTKRWLIWMAQRMVQASQTVFLIEQIQPSWLQTKLQRIRYRLGSSLIGGLTAGLIFGLSYETSVKTIFYLDPKLSFGLSFGLSYGLILVFLGNIKTVETLNSKWSWKEVKSGFLARLFFGLFLGLFLGLSFEFSSGLPFFGLITGLIVGLFFGLFFVLIGGLKGPEIQNKFKPIQGILMSAQNFLLFVISSVMIIVISSVMTFVISSGPKSGLHFFLTTGLFCGGTACLRHFVLRLMLYRMGYIPWNYARFLDYAAERLFLQKVGGGYIFIHRMLLEHFALMELK